MTGFPREGFSDLSRRLQILWLWVARLRVRRALYKAETELGWLGWEQVDFFENQVMEEVRKVQEFENTQASLLNSSAELGIRKVALDEELAREQALHDQAQAALASERAPIAAEFEQAENLRRQKLEAAGRFDAALQELAQLEKDLQARSLALMKIEKATLEVRVEAREISDHLGRLPAERKLVFADKANAAKEAARLEPEMERLRAELRRIDTAAEEVRERFAAAGSRVMGELRLLERERKKSTLRMSHLDREKRKPYQLIGACLADHNLAPLNQPEVLEKVAALRERDAALTETLAVLQAVCAAGDAGMLTAFYLLLAAVLFAIVVITLQLLH